MDVVCGRCRAEYEFDDALISERGTTVRCTNCGLQFKVFPPVGQRAPEIWQVYDSRDRRAPPVQYDSLRELQKAIARGDVRADHLLARGDGEPRAFSEIVELQPLLNQPQTEIVPEVPEHAISHEVREAEAAAVPPHARTVLGIQTRANPRPPAAAPPAPLAVTRSLDDFEEDYEIVPSEPPSPMDEGAAPEPIFPPAPPQNTTSKPRIRSALSVTPPVATTGSSYPPPESASPAVVARVSLRSTLASGFPTASQVAFPPSANLAAPRALGEDLAPLSPPPVEPLPPEEVPASLSLALPSEPKITESAPYAGQMTPTPGALRAIRSVDSARVSSVPGVAVKRQARSGGVVIAVVVGTAVFLGFANRDRLLGYLDSNKRGSADAPAPAALSQELAGRLELADIAWVSQNLFKSVDSPFDGGPSAVELSKLDGELARAGAQSSWQSVNLMRAQGKIEAARKLSGNLDAGASKSYALALLDLADSKDDPPWPVIIERLKEASTGERGRFLARTVYIYALTASGEGARAAADFGAFAQLSGAQASPLFDELKAYLNRQGALVVAADEEGDVAPPPTAFDKRDEFAEEVSPTEPVPEDPREPTEPAPRAEPAAPPKPQAVPSGVKEKVSQADALWRGGNREGALSLYREVVAKIGTTHFLGQRSAARIRQAEREKAAAP